jgi:hypothetical protein
VVPGGAQVDPVTTQADLETYTTSCIFSQCRCSGCGWCSGTWFNVLGTTTWRILVPCESDSQFGLHMFGATLQFSLTWHWHIALSFVVCTLLLATTWMILLAYQLYKCLTCWHLHLASFTFYPLPFTRPNPYELWARMCKPGGRHTVHHQSPVHRRGYSGRLTNLPLNQFTT